MQGKFTATGKLERCWTSIDYSCSFTLIRITVSRVVEDIPLIYLVMRSATRFDMCTSKCKAFLHGWTDTAMVLAITEQAVNSGGDITEELTSRIPKCGISEAQLSIKTE